MFKFRFGCSPSVEDCVKFLAFVHREIHCNCSCFFGFQEIFPLEAAEKTKSTKKEENVFKSKYY